MPIQTSVVIGVNSPLARTFAAAASIGAAFKINNPNATASCGCGTSFSL